MLDKIKNRISERVAEINDANAVDDTALVAEYAHIFQELDELEIKEDDGDEEITTDVDLPIDRANGAIEDDESEITSIDINLATGVSSVLPDAAIKSEYSMMKCEADFINEAANVLRYKVDETDEEFETRKNEYAHQNFMEYRQAILQEGAFGFSKIAAYNENIPSFATVNFGEDVSVRMPIHHQVDSKGQLTRKQVESVYLAESCNLCANLMGEVVADLRDRYNISDDVNVMESIIPAILVTPVDPIDKHAVIVGFKSDANLGDMDFYRFSNPVSDFSSNGIFESATIEHIDSDKMKQFSRVCISKNAAILESKKENPRYHRIFQEAIDLGGDAGNNDGGDQVQSTDQNAQPADNNGGDNNQNNDKVTATVTTNNVSDDIAAKVKDESENQAATQTGEDNNLNEDSNFDAPPTTDDMPAIDSTENAAQDDSFDNSEINADINNTDSQITDVDSTLNELNNPEGDDMGGIATDNLTGTEIENMSVKDLMNVCNEKLKDMSIAELRDFLAAHQNPADIQEAFILTKKNINNEVDVYLKKTLGVLNDNKLEIGDIVSEFKKYGKKLNKIITKACKIKDVYDANEIESLKKLNKCLADLIVTISASTDKSNIQTIKRLIKAYTSQAVVVGKIVDKKKDKSVQESYVQEALFTTKGTARTNIILHSGYVSNDMKRIVKAVENDKLSRGLIQKMYGGITYDTSFTVDYGYGISEERSHPQHWDSEEMDNLYRLMKTINKVTRKSETKEKWHDIFSDEELSTLKELREYVADFKEDVTSLISDKTGSDEKLLKAIGKEAKKISDTCKDISEWADSKQARTNRSVQESATDDSDEDPV